MFHPSCNFKRWHSLPFKGLKPAARTANSLENRACWAAFRGVQKVLPPSSRQVYIRSLHQGWIVRTSQPSPSTQLCPLDCRKVSLCLATMLQSIGKTSHSRLCWRPIFCFLYSFPSVLHSPNIFFSLFFIFHFPSFFPHPIPSLLSPASWSFIFLSWNQRFWSCIWCMLPFFGFQAPPPTCNARSVLCSCYLLISPVLWGCLLPLFCCGWRHIANQIARNSSEPQYSIRNYQYHPQPSGSVAMVIEMHYVSFLEKV